MAMPMPPTSLRLLARTPNINTPTSISTSAQQHIKCPDCPTLLVLEGVKPIDEIARALAKHGPTCPARLRQAQAQSRGDCRRGYWGERQASLVNPPRPRHQRGVHPYGSARREPTNGAHGTRNSHVGTDSFQPYLRRDISVANDRREQTSAFAAGRPIHEQAVVEARAPDQSARGYRASYPNPTPTSHVKHETTLPPTRTQSPMAYQAPSCLMRPQTQVDQRRRAIALSDLLLDTDIDTKVAARTPTPTAKPSPISPSLSLTTFPSPLSTTSTLIGEGTSPRDYEKALSGFYGSPVGRHGVLGRSPVEWCVRGVARAQDHSRVDSRVALDSPRSDTGLVYHPAVSQGVLEDDVRTRLDNFAGATVDTQNNHAFGNDASSSSGQGAGRPEYPGFDEEVVDNDRMVGGGQASDNVGSAFPGLPRMRQRAADIREYHGLDEGLIEESPAVDGHVQRRLQSGIVGRGRYGGLSSPAEITQNHYVAHGRVGAPFVTSQAAPVARIQAADRRPLQTAIMEEGLVVPEQSASTSRSVDPAPTKWTSAEDEGGFIRWMPSSSTVMTKHTSIEMAGPRRSSARLQAAPNPTAQPKKRAVARKAKTSRKALAPSSTTKPRKKAAASLAPARRQRAKAAAKTAAKASGKKTKGARKEHERIAVMKANPWICQFGYKHAVCAACGGRLRIDKRSRYYPYLMEKHIGKCEKVEAAMKDEDYDEERANKEAREREWWFLDDEDETFVLRVGGELVRVVRATVKRGKKVVVVEEVVVEDDE
ncbi:hypothetical protein HMN09_01103200 [Mycena chlorophos]|uniref:Uncharacterized protein n=1 Tax=Mycena chlorophos TaxID=658473 RepID=A0A8H6SCB7_MYCCL|nr:hypothetical protein HMN09_01103200 [Mycena chlorophos]